MKTFQHFKVFVRQTAAVFGVILANKILLVDDEWLTVWNDCMNDWTNNDDNIIIIIGLFVYWKYVFFVVFVILTNLFLIFKL